MSIAVASRSLLVVVESLDLVCSVVSLGEKRASRSGCMTPMVAVRLDGVASSFASAVTGGGAQSSRPRFGFAESTNVMLSPSVTPLCWTGVVLSALFAGLGRPALASMTSALLACGSVRRSLACGVGVMCVASSSVSVCVAPGDALCEGESVSFRSCALLVLSFAALPFVVHGSSTPRHSFGEWLLAIVVEVMCVASFTVVDVVALWDAVCACVATPGSRFSHSASLRAIALVVVVTDVKVGAGGVTDVDSSALSLCECWAGRMLGPLEGRSC